MRVRRPVRGRPAQLLAAIAALALVAGCGGDDDDSGGTLDEIGGTGSGVATASTMAVHSGSSGTTVPPGDAGSGFVSISVQVAADGIAETISLDRSTVAAASLDPVSLDAACTPLDDGDETAPVEVSVVDLRRLSGDRLVSAVLQYDEAGPGEHGMTLELGGADQATTAYTGTVTVDETGLAGTFDGSESGGAEVKGSFVCATEAVAPTTTTLPPPPTVPPTTAGPSTTSGPTTSTVP